MTELILPAVEPGVEVRLIPGYVGYAADSAGRVWSAWTKGPGNAPDGEWKQLKQCPTDRGYMTVGLRRGGKQSTKRVHQLVLEAFVGQRPPGTQTRHLDGNPANNRIGNLVWGTAPQQSDDKRLHGTLATGERVGTSKLTREKAVEILRRLAAGEGQVAIAAAIGIGQTVVSNIALGRTWKCIDSDRAAIGKPVRHAPVISVADRPRIRQMYASGEHTFQQIADVFGCSYTMIWKIVNGRTKDTSIDATPENA